MIEIQRSARVACTPEQMFDLVNDVEAYPKRFRWCTAAEVQAREGDTILARLDLDFAGLRHAFATRNTGLRPERIDLHLAGGPLHALDGCWRFLPTTDGGCEAQLELRFAFRQPLLERLFSVGAGRMAERMVADFVAEANRSHG